MNFNFYNSIKKGRSDSNAAIQAFESDNNAISISFIRELIQNAIDARLDKDKPVRLVFKLIDIKKEKQKDLQSLFKRILPLVKLGHNSKTARDMIYKDADLYCKALVVEEFNTSGLTGPVDLLDNEHSDWHYSNYMFGVNRKTKDEGGGSAGVGKITSNMLSDIRSILFLTNRSDDEETWVSGRTEFEAPYKMGSTTFADVAYLTEQPIPNKGVEEITPQEEEAILQPSKGADNIDWFTDTFQIERLKSDFGTSWVMLAPLQQADQLSSISPLQDISHYLDLILAEYFWAIMLGKIEIVLGDIVLDEESVLEHLIDRFPDAKQSWEFAADVAGFPARSLVRLKPNWAQFDNIDEAFLSVEELDTLRENYEDGNKVIGLKLPIKVTLPDSSIKDSFVELFMRKRSIEHKISSEYLFRDYLHISGESNQLSRLHGDPVDCILKIVDNPVVQVCRAAEKADHTKFLFNRAKSKGYLKAPEIIKNIRYSVVCIYQFLNELDVEDENILSSIFFFLTPKAKPKQEEKKNKKRKTKKTKRTYQSPDRINISAKNGTLKIQSGSSPYPANQLPKIFDISVVEKGLLSTSHDLNETDSGLENTNEVKVKNIKVHAEKYSNKMTIEILDNDFYLELDGLVLSRAAELRLED